MDAPTLSAPPSGAIARTAGPIPIRYPDYASFRAYVWDEYVPIPQEVRDSTRGFTPGTNWARRCAPRFYRGAVALGDFMREGAAILDIGAYPGSFLRLLRAAYPGDYTIHSCGMPVADDFAATLAAEGIEFRACNLDPDLVCEADMPVGLPFQAGSFDIILCQEVVEHLYSLKTILTECARVLAPGGVLYITTDNVMSRAGVLRLLAEEETNLDADIDQTSIWSDHENQWRGHVRFYSIKQLAAAAARAGLAPLRAGYFENYPDPSTIPWNDHGSLGRVRRWLRGQGDAPPVRLRETMQGLLQLGPRSLAPRFGNHIEVIFTKP